MRLIGRWIIHFSNQLWLFFFNSTECRCNFLILVQTPLIDDLRVKQMYCNVIGPGFSSHPPWTETYIHCLHHWKHLVNPNNSVSLDVNHVSLSSTYIMHFTVLPQLLWTTRRLGFRQQRQKRRRPSELGLTLPVLTARFISAPPPSSTGPTCVCYTGTRGTRNIPRSAAACENYITLHSGFHSSNILLIRESSASRHTPPHPAAC